MYICNRNKRFTNNSYPFYVWHTPILHTFFFSTNFNFLVHDSLMVPWKRISWSANGLEAAVWKPLPSIHAEGTWQQLQEKPKGAHSYHASKGDSSPPPSTYSSHTLGEAVLILEWEHLRLVLWKWKSGKEKEWKSTGRQQRLSPATKCEWP